ncbi:hypothetical protein H0255_20005 [Pectobacterium versatile]|uniref:hypothetical protein n=1 Tax=Pectobacterium versatile TaxID=2488639 RepID=UPI00102F2356|nr:MULTISPECIES: hypothetical protein [Pectobacterium]MBA0165418.1 hypothetical protein [Pectobacterium versatile]MBK4827256.1 hypothetical protein [Pectobacterium carotovorum subsp. carotovorum]MBN3059483.1 hypothetical protein [Pectobacterium versatile]TAJ03087.1 hypothetical protein EG334_16575 [Pectobacterium versatile]UNE79850.1 immunity 50 family protein [Pectobacterium versatile]
MNLLDFVRRKEFLLTLFPDGLIDEVYIGQINLDVNGRVSINVHTRQKPVLEVKEWGVWGRDYNVIVIELNGSGCEGLSVNNWRSVGYQKLEFLEGDNNNYLYQKSMGWDLKIGFDDFIFQRCNVYIDSFDE